MRELRARWPGLHGIDGRAADGLQLPHRVPMAVCGDCVRGMVREYTAGNSRGPGWREFAGIFGCAVGSSVADGAVRPGVEWLAIEPGRE